jgi:hypothetical protein
MLHGKMYIGYQAPFSSIYMKAALPPLNSEWRHIPISIICLFFSHYFLTFNHYFAGRTLLLAVA